MSSKAPTQTVKATSVIKKKTKEEQLLEALEQARAEGAEATELASVDTSNLLAQAPAAVASDAAATSTAATSTAGTTTAATTATAAGGAAAVSTGVVVAGVAGATVVAVAASNASSKNDTTVAKDTTAPTATITLSDSALKKGETATVTVTFSEAVTGFSNADLTLTSGALSDMSSSDGGKTWTGTFTPTDDYEDATNVISLATTYTDAAGNTGTTATSANYTVDTKLPVIQSLSANGDDKTVTLTYSEILDATNIPATTAFAIQVNGVDNAVTQVVANGATLVLTLTDTFTTGQNVLVTYTDADGDGTTTIQDTAGNDAVGFTQGVVADGYIRDAQMYLDAPSGLVELTGVKTDANGNFFLPQGINPNGYALVAVGGVNIDTGLPNTTPMKAPAGSTTINPLTTLVQAVIQQATEQGLTVTPETAALNVANALGLKLPKDKTLNNYDPLSATDGDPVAAQKAAAQIATLTTLAAEAAGSSDAQTAATSVLKNIANVVLSGNTETVSLSDSSVLTQALSDVTLNESQQAAIVEANTAIAAADTITAISTAQSQFVDKIAPDAPTAISIATLTKDNTPAVEVSLNTKSTDGKAAVAGDTLVILDGTTEVANITITAAHLAAGKVVIDNLPTLSEGSHTLTAKLTDKAGNASDISNASTVVVDTTGPSVVISSATDNLAAGASTTLTMTFTEAVAGLTASDLQVSGGGTVSNLAKVSDTVYTATYTAPTTGGAGYVYIAKGSYTDVAGNNGASSNTLDLAAVNPPVLSINTIGGADKVISAQKGDNLITGTAQASNGNVTVKFGDTVLGTATVATNGTWSYSLTTDNLTTIGQAGEASITAEQTRTVSGTDYTGKSAEFFFAVDTLAPTTSLSVSGLSTNDSVINTAEKAAGVLVSGTAETGSTVQLTVGTTVKTLSTTGGAWSYTLTNADYKELAKMTSPSVSAIAIDAAGNKSDAVTQAFSIDTTAPTMGFVKLTDSTDTGTKADGRTSNKTPSIEFTAESNAVVSVSVDGGKTFSTETTTGTGLLQTLTLPTLSEGVNAIVVKAVDAAGNESIRTTSIVIDSTAPTIADATPSTPENSDASKVVYTATSTDASVVSYALKQGLQDNAGHFTIESKTGKVTLKDNPNYEDIPSYSFTVVATDAAGNTSEKAVTLSITDVNEAPTAVAVTNGTISIAENTVIASAMKVADIAITDDALGTNSITLTGADAANFEVMGNALYLKAGTSLNFEAKAKYDVTVNVADSSVTGSTPVTANYSLTVTDVNEAPTAVAVTNATLSIAENTPITNPMKVADIAITDDALGTNSITLSGADAANFEVMGNALYLKAGTNLNFEAQNKLDVTVNVADASLTGSTPVTANYSLAVTNVNEAPVASKNYQSTERIVNGQALTDFTFVPDFVDPEGDNLSFTYSGTLPAGLTFTNGVVSGTPTTDGNYTFTVTASDGSLTHSQDYTVAVVSAPVVQSMTITDIAGDTNTGKQGDTLLIALKLSEAVTLSAQAAPTITISGAQAPFNATFVSQSTDGKSLTFTAIAPSGNTNTLYLQSIDLNGATIKGNTTSVDLVLSSNASATYALDNTPPEDAVIDITIGTGIDNVFSAKEISQASPIQIVTDTGSTVTSVMVDNTILKTSIYTPNAYMFNSYALEQGSHNIQVVTEDAAGNTKTTVKNFSVDSIAPSFSSAGKATAIAENSGANQIIYKATSDDTSAKYSLKAGSDDGLSIDADSGEVKLLANPNFEAKASYSFTVVATDAAGNVSEKPVVLSITDLSEDPSTEPVIGYVYSGSLTAKTMSAFLSENNTTDLIIYNANANPDDGSYFVKELSFGASAKDINYWGFSAQSFEVEVRSASVQGENTFISTGKDGSSQISLRGVTDDGKLVFRSIQTETTNENGQPVTRTTQNDHVVDYALTAANLPANSVAAQMLAAPKTTPTAVPQIEGFTGYFVSDNQVSLITVNFNSGTFEDWNKEVDVDVVNGQTETHTRYMHSSTGIVISGDKPGQIVIDYQNGANGENYDKRVTFIAALNDGKEWLVKFENVVDNNTSYYAVITLAAGIDAVIALNNAALNDLLNHNYNTNTDQTPPNITSLDKATAIAENSGTNQIIYKATSDDASAKYSLKETADHSLLSIDANSGEVKLLANPNYEVKSSYSFTVVATDAAGNVSEKVVVLSITDVAGDNNAPTGEVRVVGLLNVGETLAAIDYIQDPDGKGSVSYQWFVDGQAVGSGQTIQLIDSYVGKSVSVTASYTDGLGKAETMSSVPVTVTNLPPLFGGLSYANGGGYQVNGFSKFVNADGSTWMPASNESVMGVTSDYNSATQKSVQNIVVKTGSSYSTYSFSTIGTDTSKQILSSTAATPLSNAKTIQLSLDWHTDLLGSGLPKPEATPVIYADNYAEIYRFDTGIYALGSGTSWNLLQTADGTPWKPVDGAVLKGLIYNPIDYKLNLYYTENGVAKFIGFNEGSPMTAGEVKTLTGKGLSTAESYLGLDLDGNNSQETVTIANKWLIQSDYYAPLYFIKTTDAAGKGIFGLVRDYQNDDVTLTQGNPLSYFMKLFKTNDGANAWTPGSDDLSVKSAIFNSITKQYEVLLQSSSTEAFSMYAFGSDGNATTSTAQEVGKGELYAFETAANKDLNGDGAIGTTQQVDITKGTLTASLLDVPNFTPSTGWKIGSATLEFTSETAGKVNTTNKDGSLRVVPFTLASGAIDFDLGSGKTASYKLLGASNDMLVIASTNKDLTLQMNQEQSDGPDAVMTINKEGLTAQTLPTTSMTLHTTHLSNFGDWGQYVSTTIDPASKKVTFTDIWGVKQSTSFTVNDNVIHVDMSTSTSTNTMDLSVLSATSNGYYLINSKTTNAYQQATTTETNIKTWFMSDAGMKNTFTVYDKSDAPPTSKVLVWSQDGNSANFTANGKTYSVTYNAASNSIKFQSNADYYEEYTISNGKVMHVYTDFSVETWSAAPVFTYAFTPDTPPVIVIDAATKTATVSNIEAGTKWQYQLDFGSWVDGTGETGGSINLSAYTNSSVNVQVRQSDASGSYDSSGAEYAFQSAYFGTNNSGYVDVHYSTAASGLFDLTSGGSDRVVLKETATANGNDQIKGFTFGDTNSSSTGLGEGDLIDLSAFFGDAFYGLADANATTSGVQAFAGDSTGAVDIDDKVALVSGVTDAIGNTNGLADDIAALFGSGKTFAGLEEGDKAAVLAQGTDSASATLWYATGNANGSVTAQQVATMTNIGNLNAITQENFYHF